VPFEAPTKKNRTQLNIIPKNKTKKVHKNNINLKTEKLTAIVVVFRGITDDTDAVDPHGDEARKARLRPIRKRSARAAAARASATRLKTCLRPAATIPSPENSPDLTEGARRGGGSEPALLFLPSFSRLCG
jgi:hypothetical protein